MKTLSRVLLPLAIFLAIGVVAAQQVTITYWQYEYASKVTAINELIKKFEAENPGIKVVQQTFPYNAYNQKVASAIPAGQGPDVVNLYYGWLLSYMKAGYLQPLPTSAVDPAQIKQDFVPMVQAAVVDGKLWGLPTAVRTLALFYNKDLFKQAGISGPPTTWNQFQQDAVKLTKGSGSRMTQAGFVPGNQRYHLWREVLVRDFGGQPYTNDGKTVAYDSKAGLDAFTWYSDLVTKYKVGSIDFFPGYGGFRDAFKAGRVGMIIDGSFAVGTLSAKDTVANWGVAELPTNDNGIKANYGSFWMNGISRNTKGAKLDAAVKFVKFLASAETMQYWLKQVGELPARKALVSDPALLKDPVYGPFVAAIPYSSSTTFVDENEQRKIYYDGLNEVVKTGADPATVLTKMAKQEQALLDSYWNSTN